MKRLKMTLTYSICFLVLGLLEGCIPLPHTTERTPEIYGRVLDARTHLPIQGAKIFLSSHPNISCISDSTGHFKLNATHNFHLGSVPPEGDWPPRKYWGAAITVLCTNYVTFVQHGPDDWRLTDKGDILLEPKK